jgi:hypothetical protein
MLDAFLLALQPPSPEPTLLKSTSVLKDKAPPNPDEILFKISGDEALQYIMPHDRQYMRFSVVHFPCCCMCTFQQRLVDRELQVIWLLEAALPASLHQHQPCALLSLPSRGACF